MTRARRKIEPLAHMMLRTGRLAVFVLAWLGARPAFALDPEKHISQFTHTAWTEKDGAPSDIRAIAQTTDGYLWLGTTGGLFRFDGARFASFEPRAGETLPGSWIVSMLAARDGGLWIVFRPGNVSRLFNGHVTSYSEREGLAPTFSLAEDNDGTLIAGTATGLASFKDGVWKDAGKKWQFPAKEARRVYFDKTGTLWVVTEDRVLYLPHGAKMFVDPGDMFAGGGNFGQAFDGTVWLADTGRSAHTVRRMGDRGPMTEVRVGAISVIFDSSGALWIGSVGDGLRRVAHPGLIGGRQIAQFGPEAEQFTAKDGLSGDYVHCLMEDREGNIWVGTLRGLDRFRESTFIQVPIPHPDFPRAIFAVKDGSLWAFGAIGAGLLRIGRQGQRELLAGANAYSVCEDREHILWMVAMSAVVRFRSQPYMNVAVPMDASLQNLIGVECDRAGGIWLFDRSKGLLHLANGALTNVAVQPDHVYGWAVLHIDAHDRVWVGLYDRVVLYDRGKLQDFRMGDGIPEGAVFTIFEDRNNDVWIGSDGGLSKFENGHFRALPRSSGFPARSVYGLAEDDEGYWWVAADTGVLRIPPGDLARAVAASDYRIRYESFDTLDGLPGKPRRTPPMPMVARTTDGRIWFATTNGVAYVDPRRLPKNRVPPPVYVETVKIDGKELTPESGIALSHRTNDLEIDYTAPQLVDPGACSVPIQARRKGYRMA